jgi:ribonuclease-3
VLQLITAEHLYKLRSDAKEGELTQIRSSMVNTNTLAQLAEQLEIGNYLYLGKGISKGGGRNLRSLLANAFEALLGAIFLDAGYEAAYHYYLDRYRGLPEGAQDVNYKGRLQQVVQERFGTTPYYDSEGARVGAQREYTSVVFADAEPLGTGHGGTKQEAEQDAAKAALEKLVGNGGAAAAPRPRTPRPRGRRTPAPKPAEVAGTVDSEPPALEPAGPPAAEPEPEPLAESEPGPMPEPAPEPPRSRQFGALPED